MDWVASIGWNGSNYRLVTVNDQGEQENRPVSSLHELEFAPGRTSRIRVTLDFESWTQVPARDYLAGIGFSNEIGSGQEVHEFEAAGRTFQVPAVVLMKGMFRPLRGIAPYLFKPMGHENMMVAVPSKAESVGFFCKTQTGIGLYPARSGGILNALSWMYCFPSARRMWDSILVKARTGKLGMALPEGKATLVLQAFLHEKKWLVTNFTVIAVETSETPFEFAASHAKIIEFHQGAYLEAHGRKKPPKKLITLPSRDGCWQLSDNEWSAVESIVAKGRSVRHSLREIIDCILDKFGRGIAWNKVPYGRVNRPVTVAYYQRMLKDGRWDALVNAIQKLRAPLLGSVA